MEIKLDEAEINEAILKYVRENLPNETFNRVVVYDTLDGGYCAEVDYIERPIVTEQGR